MTNEIEMKEQRMAHWEAYGMVPRPRAAMSDELLMEQRFGYMEMDGMMPDMEEMGVAI